MSIAVHGGPDGGAPITHDFSSNVNPLGPPPEVAAALQAADRRRYPDPHYRTLRERLAGWHGAAPSRVLSTAGTSEAIRRLTLAALGQGIRTVWLPQPGYGDYRAAALALRLSVRDYASADALLQGMGDASEPALVWLCEPCNPTGRSLPTAFWSALVRMAAQRSLMLALDRAYEPLRLEGEDPVPQALAQQAWQCFSPNKAFGLTGVRAGYLLAPAHDGEALLARVESLAPSWVLAAEGVALLDALPDPATQTWLAQSRRTLAYWAQAQREGLQALGWRQRHSTVPFWLAQPVEQGEALQHCLIHLRAQGIKLRDAASFGLPGWVRVSAQPPAAQQALVNAWRQATGERA